MRRVLFVLAFLALLAAAPAQAADPIMRLSHVRSDRDCEGRTVIRGTDISSFDVRVIDVVDMGSGAPRVLVEVSGPAVESTGIARGFSGAPVYCTDDAGVPRVIGAIATGVGEYGDRKGLVTPIEEMLGEPVHPRRPIRRASRTMRRSVRPLITPLTVSGLSPGLGRLLMRAGARAGRPLLAAPSAPFTSFAPQELVPGASMAAGFSSGDIAVSAVGTVTYTRGSKLWAFGHPLEGVGRRSLLLQDAYVYDVISNPDTGEASSYKLAAPGHDLGSILNDASSAAVGRVGGLPDLIETTVRVRDLDNGGEDVSTTRIADETDVGLPSGGSPLGFIAPLAIFDAGARVLSGTPARQSDAMCVRIRLRERRRPLGFCNRYVTDGGAGFEGIIALAQQLQAEDLGEAIRLIESYKAGRIHVESVEADVDLRRGLRQAYMLSASARGGPVAAGDVVPVSLRLRVTRGPLRTVRFRLPVPRHLKPGTHAIRLSGTAEDSLESLEGGEEIIIELVEDVEDEPGAGLGPRSMKALAAKVAALSRFDGVRARFGSGRRSKPVRVFRHPELRISGKTVLRLRLSRPRRP